MTTCTKHAAGNTAAYAHCYSPSWLDLFVGQKVSLSLQQCIVWKHPGPEVKCRGSTQGQYHCMTYCLTYAHVHCLCIVSMCSMYVFSIHEYCVFIFVPHWMRPLFSTRAESTRVVQTRTECARLHIRTYRACERPNLTLTRPPIIHKHIDCMSRTHIDCTCDTLPNHTPTQHMCLRRHILIPFWVSKHSSNMTPTQKIFTYAACTHTGTPEHEQLVCVCVCRRGSGLDVCV